MAAILLTTPTMLWGLALLALPIVAHLWRRRVRQRIALPTTALLAETVAVQTRWLRVRDAALLALRCLAMAALVLAFARPVWRLSPEEAEAGAGGETGGAVLVIDASASTSRLDNGVSVLERLRGAAEREAGAAVIAASARPRVVAAPTVVAQGYDRADWPAALSLAAAELARHDVPRRLVVLTDMQATNWSDAQALAQVRLPAATSVRFVTVADAGAENSALALPRIVGEAPLEGRPGRVGVTVANFAPHPRRTRVTMAIDDAIVAERQVDVEPWAQVEAHFDATFAVARPYGITFALPGDALAADDAAYLVVRPIPEPRVALFAGDADTPDTAGYYVRRAAPQAERLGPVALIANANVIIVAEPAALAPDERRLILDRVADGAGVLWFVDAEGDVPAEFPWRPSAAREHRDEPLGLLLGDDRDGVLAPFDERSDAAFAAVRCLHSWRGEARADARVLLRYSDGAAAVVLGVVGGGQAIVVNVSPAPHASDLGQHGVFVALVQRLLETLAAVQGRSEPGPPTLVGAAATFPAVAFTGALTVVGPRGQSVETQVTADVQAMRTVRAETALPGFYRLMRNGRAVEMLAVNVDPRESDPRPLALTPTLGVADGGVGATVFVNDAEQYPRPLWHWCVLLACAALAAEMALAAGTRRR